MSEAAQEAPAPDQEQPTPEGQADAPPSVEELQAKLDSLTKESRKWEARAKENSGAAKAAEKARLDAMSEQERAIEEAKQSARTEAATTYGKRLATSEIRAAAATSGADLDGVFDYLDLGRFVGEDGEPDEKAIKAFVDGLPKRDTPPPSFDGGTRTPAQTSDFNQALRRAAGRA